MRLKAAPYWPGPRASPQLLVMVFNFACTRQLAADAAIAFEYMLLLQGMFVHGMQPNIEAATPAPQGRESLLAFPQLMVLLLNFVDPGHDFVHLLPYHSHKDLWADSVGQQAIILHEEGWQMSGAKEDNHCTAAYPVSGEI